MATGSEAEPDETYQNEGAEEVEGMKASLSVQFTVHL